eukprot:CAMPEP_0184858492 /NCGR_PEP_ID=MMETSP0580-20130426/3588_1 /TAXON_ID=1118495 /ORGANISM="Dactyliosolen fragilissimus" /LENGTH=271 /DNA_ID=CAMNT_0027354659 /DNA_START=81 /DNA_END=893 /DNA_ORIENTATION=-
MSPSSTNTSQPTFISTKSPTIINITNTSQPTFISTKYPTIINITNTSQPTYIPTEYPTIINITNTSWPTNTPTEYPIITNTSQPTYTPTEYPIIKNTSQPTNWPTIYHSTFPTSANISSPTSMPSILNYTSPTLEPTVAPGIGSETFFLQSALSTADTKWCITWRRKHQYKFGSNVVLQHCRTNSTNQIWEVDDKGFIRSGIDRNACLAPMHLILQSGTDIAIYQCPQHYHPAFSWITDTQDGSIQNAQNRHLVLDVTGGYAANGAVIQLW